MAHRPPGFLALGLAALLALPAVASAQEGGAGEAKPAAPAKPKGDEPAPLLQGSRFRVTLRNGSRIEGVLLEGVVWEKRDQYGDYVQCDEKDKDAGLLLHYVLNMEGETFIPRKDIADGKEAIHDLGVLSEQERLALQEKMLEARKRAVAERERKAREEYEKLAAAQREAEERAAALKKARGEAEGEGKAEPTEEEKKGDALLKKFPPPDWSESKKDELLRREIVVGVYRNDEEREFTDPDNFRLWKAALERKQKADAEKKEKEDAEKARKEGAGGSEKKETPPQPAPAPEEKEGGG
jgi:hypothetical protein